MREAPHMTDVYYILLARTPQPTAPSKKHTFATQTLCFLQQWESGCCAIKRIVAGFFWNTVTHIYFFPSISQKQWNIWTSRVSLHSDDDDEWMRVCTTFFNANSLDCYVLSSSFFIHRFVNWLQMERQFDMKCNFNFSVFFPWQRLSPHDAWQKARKNSIACLPHICMGLCISYNRYRSCYGQFTGSAHTVATQIRRKDMLVCW